MMDFIPVLRDVVIIVLGIILIISVFTEAF